MVPQLAAVAAAGRDSGVPGALCGQPAADGTCAAWSALAVVGTKSCTDRTVRRRPGLRTQVIVPIVPFLEKEAELRGLLFASKGVNPI